MVLRRRRTRSSRRRCPRPGRAGAGRPVPASSRVAPVKENFGLLVTGDDLGLNAQDVQHPTDNSSRLSASREAEVATKRTRCAPCSLITAAYSRQAGEGPLQRLGGEAARSCRRPRPDGTRSSYGGPGRPVPGLRVDVGDQEGARIEFRTAVDGRNPGHLASSAARVHGALRRPHSRRHLQRLVAQWVHPGQPRGRSTWATDVGHFGPGPRPHAARAGEARQLLDLVAAPGMCSPRARRGTRRPLLVALQTAVISFITPFALPASAEGGLRARQVVYSVGNVGTRPSPPRPARRTGSGARSRAAAPRAAAGRPQPCGLGARGGRRGPLHACTRVSLECLSVH
ncbi:hypothetical protein SALBM311S_06811 [Streptomyces alboniger]